MDIFSSIKSRSINLKSINPSLPFSRSDTAEYGSLVWTFDPSNRYLSAKLTKFTYNKRTVRVMIISFVLAWLIGFSGAPLLVFISLFIVLEVFLWIPFITLLILSFNKDAIGFIIGSSEFWIKIVYSEINAILEFILYHKASRKLNRWRDVPEWIGYSYYILVFFAGPMFMVIVGGADAIPEMKSKSKACLIGIVAINTTLWALIYQFFSSEEDDYTFEVKATASVISLHALLGNVNGMLAMFMWKQMIDVLRHSDRCVSILYRPYLRWEIPRSKLELTEPENPGIPSEFTFN